LVIRSATKLQKRVRIWIAKRVFKSKRMRWDMAIVIQTQMRVCLAKALVARIRKKLSADTFATVSTIQKNVRRWIAVRWLDRQRRLLRESRKIAEESGNLIEPEVVTEWLSWYGVDQEYGLKRNRRITDRLFASMLKTRFVRLKSRFGIVYVECYPPRKTEEEILQELQKGSQDALTIRDDFISVYLPTFDPVSLHRGKAIEQFNRFNHIAILHLPTSVEKRQSVDFLVTTVQCAQRQRVARGQFVKMLRVHKAIAKFQKIFRRRYELQHRAAVKIVAMFRMVKASKRTGRKRLERNSAVIIQCSYRCFRARSAMFDLRSVQNLSVLRSTESLPLHGAEKSLEHRMDTFWIALSPEKAEIRVEFAKSENIVEIWIQTSTFSASPSCVSLAIVKDKKKGYEELIEKIELPMLVGDRWHKFPIPVQSTKYVMIEFWGNYGDDKYISIRQIRFIRSKESMLGLIDLN
jgi:hypothetical protein